MPISSRRTANCRQRASPIKRIWKLPSHANSNLHNKPPALRCAHPPQCSALSSTSIYTCTAPFIMCCAGNHAMPVVSMHSAHSSSQATTFCASLLLGMPTWPSDERWFTHSTVLNHAALNPSVLQRRKAVCESCIPLRRLSAAATFP